MKITVLCGGISTEREISFRTSVKVANALKKKGHDVFLVDVFFGTCEVPDFSEAQDFSAVAEALRKRTCEITEELKAEYGIMGPNVLACCKAADIVFIGLHGENGEDGKVQAILEENGIKYTGSDSESSALAMSKAKTKELLTKYIRMPEGIIVTKEEFEEKKGNAKKTHVPCVIKPSNGGSSVGVMLVMDETEYETALKDNFKYDETVLIEKFIRGRELTQGVLNGMALPPVEIIPDGDSWYDYENKYNGKPLEVCPAQIPEEVLAEMSDISVRIGELLGLSVYYRIDYILDGEGKLYALEANSLPGMTDTSLVPQEAQAIGMNYEDLCEKIIEISLEKYQ